MYLTFFSIVRMEHTHIQLLWQYIVFYKFYFDQKLIKHIADPDRKSICLYNSSF